MNGRGGGRRRIPRVFLYAAALCASMALPPPAHGADPLRGSLRPLVTCTRQGAPIPVDVVLDWTGAGILEGRLAIEMGDGRNAPVRHETADLALTTGPRTFRFLLPPIDTSETGVDQLATARAWFIAASGSRLLFEGSLPLRLGAPGSTLLAICRERSAGDEGRGLDQSLRADVNADESDVYGQASDRTYASRWTAEDMPATPLAYCAFDVLYIAAESLPLLKGRQADAIARWVAAGGSLCVGENTSSPDAARAFVGGLLTTAGEPEDAVGAAAAVIHPRHLTVGLGRCAVTDGAAPVPPETRAFLWNVRPGKVDSKSAQAQQWRHNAYRRRQFDQECAAALIGALLPRGIRPVPLGTLAMALLGLLVAVGPLDYWVLGRLRLRRFTWLLFPALVALTTVGVIALANRHLGRHHHGRSMTLTDVGRDGHAVRTHRFDVVFAGRGGTTEFDRREAVWARGYQAWNPYGYRRGRYRGNPESAVEGRTVTRGAFPLHYSISMPVAQWQPVWHHTFRCQGDPPPLPIAWNAVDAAYLRSRPPIDAIRKRLMPSGDSRGVTVALCRGQRWTTQDTAEPTTMDVVRRLTVGDGDIPPAAACPTAPCVGDGLNRLALGDSQEDTTPVVVVIITAGDDVHVYRRRYDEH